MEKNNTDEVNGNGHEVLQKRIAPAAILQPVLFGRYFSFEGKNPFEYDIYGNPIKWVDEDVKITDDMGKVVFTQPNVRRPDFWSPLAIKVVAGKYFWGDQAKNQRENSVEQLVGRIGRWIGRQALVQGYFVQEEADVLRDEISAICLNQLCVFNSPVWFNVGIQEYDKSAGGVSAYVWDRATDSIIPCLKNTDRPQCAACFIQGIQDNMESIMEVQVAEANLFKQGSGTGTNRSPLRSTRERLTGGGKPSGPVSFMKGYDAYAGIIKSGGKTRRAAKMEILNVDHPDVMEFIEAKQKEEKKAWALIEQGYDGGMNGEAYGTVRFQNCNMSVRAPDEFMEAVKNNGEWQTKYVKNKEVCETLKARDIIKKIAEGTWICGDPGMQFDTIINKYHTSKNTGRINASNPCSEYLYLDDSACNLASINLMKFRTEDAKFDVEKFREVVKKTIISMDLIVDGASYPTAKITRNSRDHRPLGLGYANLGALLMSLGLPYDSDEGRAVAASITAVMCGEAYKTSALLAQRVGPFPAYMHNREPMLEVMKMHRDHVKEIEVNKMPADLRYLVNDAWDSWDEAVKLGEVHGFRNSQATVLAPTGCLVGNSLVSTDKGLVRMNKLGNVKGDKWQDTSFRVMTDEGPKEATKFYVNGDEQTRVIKTGCGYEIQGTEKHRIKILNPETKNLEWKRFADVAEGDIIPLAMNTIFGETREVMLPLKPEMHWNADFDLKTPEKMTEQLAEIIGYFMGDGSLHSKGLRFCVTDGDEDVIERLRILIRELFNLDIDVRQEKGYKEISVNSVPLTIWWDACGFSKIKPNENHKGKGYTPYIPDAVLHTNDRKIYCAFLRGLFEADGTVNLGVPAVSSASKEFYQEIKTLLLSLGYPTTTKVDKSGWGEKELYVLRLKNVSYNKSFADEVGFMGIRKVNSMIVRSEQTGKRDYVYLPEETIDEAVPVGSAHRDAVLISLRRHNAIPREMVLSLYQDSKNPMLLQALQFFYDRVESNNDGGVQPTYDLSVPNNVTYIANGFVSHNTIAFMMDCDTTGIEPDIALVKYKVLAGGGMLKIVNRSVPLALRNLGYSNEQIENVIDYIDKEDTIEGAPWIRDEHLAIFDCAFKAAKGKRYIHHRGHIKMMGVCQPFVSGAISKTVNMPEHSTVDDIAETYMFAWEQGLKAVAIYRENSKRSQPLNTQKTEGEMAKKTEKIVRVSERKKLPQTRKSITHKFDIAGHEGYVTVGLYDDGKPGEIFVTMHKQGSTIRGLMDSWATSVSLNLQYGIPVDTLFNKFRYAKFEPAGFVKNQVGGELDERSPRIRTASSIVDYVAQFMLNNFATSTGKVEFEIEGIDNESSADLKEEQKTIKDFGNEGVVCPLCGGAAKRIGNCAVTCTSCNQTSRSGCGE